MRRNLSIYTRSHLNLALLLATFAAPALADWPQWAGPSRDWHAAPRAKELASTWPAEGPKVLWRHALGEGYSSIAVQGGIAVTLFRRGDEESAIAFDEATGRELWRHSWQEPAQRFNDRFGLGPYSTPSIRGPIDARATGGGATHGGFVVVVSSGAQVRALDLETGELRWRRDLWREIAAPEQAGPGYTPSPLIVESRQGPLVILPLGHAEGKGVVALHLESGKLAWSSGDDAGAHSSPILASLGGHRQVVVVSKAEIAGLDPSTGNRFWRLAHENPNGANVLTPLATDTGVFVSSGPDKGSRLLKVRPSADRTITADEAWSSPRLRIFYSNAVRIGSELIGSNGGVGPAMLTAVRFATGDVLWRNREVGRANLVVAGAHLLALEDDGTLLLLRADAEGLQILARHPLFPDRSWTPPALAGRRLFARDREHIVALELP
ncbi:MAG: PQQ-binding-like beta-propeller repeat protein [Acidobacteriota bacterium]